MKHINLLRKIAWSFHQTSKLDFDDLFQEAYLAYDKALKNYDPDKGKLTTFIWYCIHSHLKNYLKEENKYHNRLCDIKEAMNKEINQIPFWEKIEIISDKLFDAVEIIINNANNIDSFLQKPSIQYVKKILINNGYSQKESEKIIFSLQNSFK